ncbi:hypothetical protein GDO86_017739 [Hymenochirus boettgeri]|uniref:Peptidase S1 domain-containing protein n=1 Tax=Hymenochirus boettgeri TaxID=247094 RepID=A0A8T2IR78_9PIPI|nr:hypothetical protein GDO86_017739 [Hymenochirus boettgeri]
MRETCLTTFSGEDVNNFQGPNPATSSFKPHASTGKLQPGVELPAQRDRLGKPSGNFQGHKMKTLSTFLLLCISFCRSQDPTTAPPQPCGIPVFAARIVGGSDTRQGAWPWQASVMLGGSHICGGTLISNQWILSAAHCFEYPSMPSRYEIRLGAYQLYVANPHEVRMQVAQIFVNSKFDGPGSSGDIALVKLSSPVKFTEYILPICLSPSSGSFPTGTECWVTGWGFINSDVKIPYPGTLQKVMAPIISRDSCEQMYHSNSLISASETMIQNDQICAGYQTGQKDACQGDSGGPLVCKSKGVWYQVGVVSWGEGCAEANRPGVYTLVSAYQSWVSSYSPMRSTPDSSSSVLTASASLLGVCLLLHKW